MGNTSRQGWKVVRRKPGTDETQTMSVHVFSAPLDCLDPAPGAVLHLIGGWEEGPDGERRFIQRLADTGEIVSGLGDADPSSPG